MRLPSYTTQDQKEMIRTLAAPHIEDGSEIVMDAEEYLQPRDADSRDQGLSDGSMSMSMSDATASTSMSRLGSRRDRLFYPSSTALSSSNSRHSMMGSLASWGDHGPADYKTLGASHNPLPGTPGFLTNHRRNRRNSQDFFGKDTFSSHFGSMIGIPIHESIAAGPGASSFMSVPKEVACSRTMTPNPAYTNRAFGASLQGSTNDASVFGDDGVTGRNRTTTASKQAIFGELDCADNAQVVLKTFKICSSLLSKRGAKITLTCGVIPRKRCIGLKKFFFFQVSKRINQVHQEFFV